MAFEVLSTVIPAFGAGLSDGTYEIGVAPASHAQGTFSLTKLSVTSPALVTGATATQITMTFRQIRAGSSVGTLGTLVTATGTNLPAETEVPVTLTGTPQILANDIIDCVVTHSGAGTAHSELLLRAELQ